MVKIFVQYCKEPRGRTIQKPPRHSR
jgi:hypothetical protein